jgi:enamine deaminase RidA (YjgF/YER057c/UK114 family)
MVYVSGQGGRNPETNQFGSFKEQCETSLNSITALLKEAGTSIDNVVSVTSWLVRREDYTEYNEIYRKAFPKDPPSRTTAFVNLSNPEMLLEITCIAAIPS